jgi:hypothetical protein
MNDTGNLIYVLAANTKSLFVYRRIRGLEDYQAFANFKVGSNVISVFPTSFSIAKSYDSIFYADHGNDVTTGVIYYHSGKSYLGENSAISHDGKTVALSSGAQLRIVNQDSDGLWKYGTDTNAIQTNSFTSTEIVDSMALSYAGDVLAFSSSGISPEVQVWHRGQGDNLNLSRNAPWTKGIIGDPYPFTPNAFSLGSSVALSATGFKLAVGLYSEGPNSRSPGVQIAGSLYTGGVHLFNRADGTRWTYVQFIVYTGAATFDRAGFSTSLSNDGTVLAYGSRPQNSMNIFGGLHIAWQKIKNAQTNLQTLLDTQQSFVSNTSGLTEYPRSVRVSGDGRTVICSTNYSESRGIIRVYKNNSTYYTEDSSIIGLINELIGEQIEISMDGNIIVTCGQFANKSLSTGIKLYRYTGTSWELAMLPIGTQFDRARVRLSANADILAVSVDNETMVYNIETIIPTASDITIKDTEFIGSLKFITGGEIVTNNRYVGHGEWKPSIKMQGRSSIEFGADFIKNNDTAAGTIGYNNWGQGLNIVGGYGPNGSGRRWVQVFDLIYVRGGTSPSGDGPVIVSSPGLDTTANQYISSFRVIRTYIQADRYYLGFGDNGISTSLGGIGWNFFYCDIRIKHDIKEPIINNACDYIEKIAFKSFRWDKSVDPNEAICELGIIAQQLEEVHPNFINFTEDSEKHKMINTNVFSTFMMKGIQELIIENKQLKADICRTKSEIEELKKEIEELKSGMQELKSCMQELRKHTGLV